MTYRGTGVCVCVEGVCTFVLQKLPLVVQWLLGCQMNSPVPASLPEFYRHFCTAVIAKPWPAVQAVQVAQAAVHLSGTRCSCDCCTVACSTGSTGTTCFTDCTGSSTL